MIITPSTIFSVDGCKCFLVVMMDETGSTLEDVAKADTSSGTYWKIRRDADGLLMYDNGVAVVDEMKCEQFFFTIAAPCRCENPAARECGPICGGAALE